MILLTKGKSYLLTLQTPVFGIDMIAHDRVYGTVIQHDSFRLEIGKLHLHSENVIGALQCNSCPANSSGLTIARILNADYIGL